MIQNQELKQTAICFKALDRNFLIFHGFLFPRLCRGIFDMKANGRPHPPYIIRIFP